MIASETRIQFVQRGLRALARYAGGSIRRGCRVGVAAGPQLKFRYVQVEASGKVHSGRSACEILTLRNGRTRILEHFEWRSRAGSGTNIFDELP